MSQQILSTTIRLWKISLTGNSKWTKSASAWVSDITYIKTTQGWLYLTVILDLADRRVIGWALSSTMKAMDRVKLKVRTKSTAGFA